ANWQYVFDSGNVSLNAVTQDDEGHGIAVGALNGDFYVYRFNTSDLTQFGDPISTDLNDDSTDVAYGVVVQGDGKIVVGGVADDDSGPEAALVRYEPQPAEPNFVDTPLSPTDTQNLDFTYTDDEGETQQVPQDLVNRVKAIRPDGTLDVFGT